MDPIHLVVPEEIALEGLDGITLDALWFRLSERLKLLLPLNRKFQNEIWKFILTRTCFEFYEIDNDRPTPKKLDRKDFLFNTEIPDDDMFEHMKSNYYIYSHHPVDHPEIRGSCQEFTTRRQLNSSDVKTTSLDEIEERYKQKFIIVANQKMRNLVLIPRNVGRECDINNVVYCILERIGRARYFGEATSGPFSLYDFVKDSKLLHYLRNSLLKNQLVIRQHIHLRTRSQSISGQLFHLPRFHTTFRVSNMVLTEKLFDFLLEKPNHIADVVEARALLNILPKPFNTFLKSRNNVFRHDIRTLYRDCFPEATDKECLYKNKAEKTISTVRLIDPTMDIFKLWHMEEDDVHGDDKGFMETSNQKLNRPLIHQVYEKILESGKEGMSQLEISKYFGLPKLNARSVLRKLQRNHNVSFYMKDEGRQRVSKYVTKDAAHDASMEFVAEMAKLMMKADESSIQPPIPITKPDKESPTKVSIPLSPTTLNLLKPEQSQKSAIQFLYPQEEQEVSSNHIFLEPERVAESDKESELVSVIVPIEDSSFVDNVEDVSISMRFLNSIPKTQKQSKGLAQAVAQNKISQKVLTRMNAVLDIVKNATVIDSVSLLHLMRQKEENLPESLCKKSMFSLCQKLAADNFLKVIEMELKSEKKNVKTIFFGEPNVSFDMRCWHSIIEEQKIQHFVPFHRHDVSNDLLQSELVHMPSNLSITSKTSIASEEFEAQSKRFTNFPKFMKMKLFHEFLFYLIYAFPSDYKKLPIKKAFDVWIKDNPKLLEHDKITENITNCYSTDISWKMFVPPLNQQRDYKNGWALIRDIIHRIPLILFVKFTRAGQGSPELNEYLSHPIKCNYLLHFLPGKLREQLLLGRKHAFVVQDLCKKLCWCGLLQFGPARTKEIDQSYIYLNRNGSLWDTTSSEPGYMEVSDKEYPVISFSFDSSENVADYWNQMYRIALNTKLNKKSAAIGKTIEIELIGSKPELQAALKVQTPISAPFNDNGSIPGDHKGAAGLDRAFLSHLKRSWTRSLESGKRKRSRAISCLSATAVAKAVRSRMKKEKSAAKETAAKIKSKSISVAQSKFKGKTGLNVKSRIIKKADRINVIRKKELLAQDAVDKAILKSMKTRRVNWCETEDKTLLLTKVAMKFAFTHETQSVHYITASVYRDILHWRTDKALNKTSKACSRRVLHLLKSKPFKEQIALYHEELRANQEFTLKYRHLADRLREIYPTEDVYDAVKIHIVEMVHRMHQIFYKQFWNNKVEAREEISLNLPEDYNELMKNYKITNPADTLIDHKYKDPSTPLEAEISMIMSLIHSAVCCSQDKTSYLFQLFEVYKKFGDADLSTAVSLLKRATVISINKKDKNKNRSILPYAFSPFHLSTRYSTQISGVHVPVELYDEYLKAIKAVSDSNGSYAINNVNCGWIFMLAEMISSERIVLSYDKAEKLVMVDPSLQKKSKFDRISEDYIQMMNQKQLEGDKQKKSVKIQNDDNNETFLYSDDPIEIFFKIAPVSLHVFCILNALHNDEEVQTESWSVSEDGECNVKKCVMVSDVNFDDNIRRIASEGSEMVNEILQNSLAVNRDRSIVTKQNFVLFFDDALQKHWNDSQEKNRKDFCGKVMQRWRKLSADALLEAIHRLATELGLEEDSWLGEYKKITRKPEEDSSLDDDDLDSTVNQIKHAKMFNQLKDLNVTIRTCDSFVVNLSTIYVDVLNGPVEKISFQGSEIEKMLIPFNEEDRAGFVEKIVSDAKFKPGDLDNNTDLFDALRSLGIDNTLEIMQISEVLTFVQSKGQMGAKSDELLDMFTEKNRLQRQMETLFRTKFATRVGVIETRFIHKEFAPFWLIDSFYFTRDENKAQENSTADDQACEESSNVLEIDNEPDAKKPKVDSDEPSTSTAAVLQKEPKKAPLIQNSIRVRPSPWIRVDGTLNRRVIDKWLGTILNQLTISPGMCLSDLINKFNILTPFDLRWLCEILEMIGSVQLMTIYEPEIDLFTTSYKSIVEPSSFFCPPNKIFIELKCDAMQRLAFFIGRKKYKAPFI